jgi:hypothetical protein
MHTKLSSLCPHKFNPWTCYYFMLAFECDTPILESIVACWPLILDWGEDKKTRDEGMALLYVWLRDLSTSMHAETTDLERESGEDDLMHYSEIWCNNGVDSRRCRVQRLLGQNQPSVIISIQIRDGHGLQNSWTVGFTCDNVGPPQGPIREQKPSHISTYFVKSKRREDDIEFYSYEVPYIEPLRFVTYVEQIQFCLNKFVDASQEYWRDKGSLPKTLNI